ncbi:MAG: hypothetical protein H7Z37_13495 [Pyrinomonadaceae bacterium]|nr:hypothetical protein [Pyrinomonadaceae bacterium]
MRCYKHRLFYCLVLTLILISGISAQEPQKDDKNSRKQRNAQTVTIPISISEKKNGDDANRGELIQAGNISIKENGEERKILSLRSTTDSPLTLAILIQDDLSSNVNLELDGIRKFITNLPKGTRVGVGYLRAGSLQVRQKFTEDLDKAAKSLRILGSSSTVAPANPYDGVLDTLKRFENQPNGRRAILLISDGLDTLRGIDSASPNQSIDLNRAVLNAQRNGVAVYSIYASATSTNSGNSLLVGYGQGSLQRLSDETGGRAYFQGFSTPVSFAPFLRRLDVVLSRQFALTYLSNNNGKDFRRIDVSSDNSEIKVEHPKGISPK